MQIAPPIRRLQDPGPDLNGLRPMEDVSFKLLDPSVRYLWFIGRLIFWGIVMMIVSVVYFAVILGTSSSFIKTWLPYGWLALAGLALLNLIWPFVSYKYWGYAIRNSDFLIRSGVIYKRIVAIPFARIQHVDSGSGMFDRLFGVANVSIHTAGSQMGTMMLPGLPSQDAEGLRDYLSEVGHSHANI